MPKRQKERPRRGVVSGYVIRLCRLSAGTTQEDLAEAVGVDRGTIQGWESGRRPITAARYGDATALTHRLVALGARGDLVAALEPAADADHLLAALLDLPPETVDLEAHPLGGQVLSHAVVEMVAWALVGHPPRVYAEGPRPRRRGPSADRPELDPGDAAKAFAALRVLADRAADRQPLLHRQALFLASDAPDAEAPAPDPDAAQHWRRSVGWTPHWPRARSLAIALARSGDPEPLRGFLEHADDAWERANLQYWAYWCGDAHDRQADDDFMASPTLRWRGTRLYGHLTRRLDPTSTRTELNIHTLWSLLLVRPGLPADDPEATARLLGQAVPLLDSGILSARAEGELRSVRYALMMQGHTAEEQP